MSVTTSQETYVDTVSGQTLYVFHACTPEIEYIEYTLDDDGAVYHRHDGPAFIGKPYGDSSPQLYWHEYWLNGVSFTEEEFIRYQEIVNLTLT